jgi:alpha-tubulin suppressor-like RCC1 family protein
MRLTLSHTSSADIVVTYTVADGTAAGSGTDYTLANGTVTIPAGSTTANISAVIVNDAVYEGNETFAVTLQSADGGTIVGATNVNTHTITDDEAKPTVQFALSADHASEALSPHNIVVDLVGGTTQSNVVANYTVTDGTAIGGGTDYTLASGTVTILAGATSATLAATIINDVLAEGNEDFVVTLTSMSSTNASLGTTLVHTHTIDDNEATPTVSFSLSGSTVNENLGTVNVDVALSGASGSAVDVDVTATGTATIGAGNDYTMSGAVGSTSTLHFASGEILKTLVLTVNDDAIGEANETAILTLNNISGGGVTVGATNPYTLTINDNDTPTVGFTLATSSAAESVGTKTVGVTLSKAADSNVVVSVTYAGTATGGTDYTQSASVTITAGQTTANISLPVIDDTDGESDETVILTLASITSTNASGANATIDGAANTHTLTITDNDAAPFTWLGSTHDAKWSTAGNWSGGVKPGVGNVAIFTSACASYCSVMVDEAASVLGMDIQASFTGTISQQVYNMTVGVSGWSQAAGTFTGHGSYNLTNSGDFSLSGGTFSGGLVTTVSGSAVSITGGTFTIANTFSLAGAGAVSVTALNKNFNNLKFAKTNSAGDITFATNVSASSLDISNTAAVQLLGSTISVTGGGVSGLANSLSGGTTTLSFASASNQTITGASGMILPNVAIVQTGGSSLTFSGTVQVGGDFTNTSGVVVTTGSTLEFAASTNATITSNGMTFNNVTFKKSSASAKTITLADNMTVAGNLVFNNSGGGAHLVSGNTISVAGNVTNTSNGGGTTAITLDGAGTQTLTQAGGAVWPTGIITSNKTAGVVTLASDITLGATQDLDIQQNANTYANILKMSGYNLTVDNLNLDAGTKVFKECMTLTKNSLTGTGTIYNGKDVTLDIASDSQTEGTQLSFVVSVTPQNCEATTFDYATSDATALAASDYTAIATTQGTINANTSSTTLNVTTTNDAVHENSEYMTMTLSNLSSGVTPGTIVGTGTIVDNDVAPTISINSTSVVEGVNASLVVTLSSPSGVDVTFDWATTNGTAVSPTDYAANSGSGTITAGNTTYNLNNLTSTVNDGAAESTEYFTVDLSNIVAATAGTISGQVDLLDTTNRIVISNLTASSLVSESAFDAQITFANDANSNAVVTLWYCNQTDSAGCDPLTGTSFVMTRGAGVYTAAVSGLSSPNDSGDVLNLAVVTTDVDSVVGSPLSSTVTLLTAPPITVTGISSASITTTGFTINLPFTGDSNHNSAATLYYCNATDNFVCDPLTVGTSVAMVRGTGNYSKAVSGLSSPNDPGDEFNIYVAITDADGVTGSPQQIQLPGVLLDVASPLAVLYNAPPTSSASNITVLNVSVGGTGIISYKYKVGVTGSTDCTVSAGYSAETLIATKITDNISANADLTSLTLCVVGKSSSGTWQTYALSTSVTWVKDVADTARTITLSTTDEADFEQTKSVSITLTMSGTKAYDVVVDYEGNGLLTYSSEQDAITTSNAGTMTIVAGQTTVTKTVALTNDASVETDEYTNIKFRRIRSNRVTFASTPPPVVHIDVLDNDTNRVVPVLAKEASDTNCMIFGGVLKCWGYNGNATIGDGTSVNNLNPTIIDVGTKYKMITTTMWSHSCGITTAGVLKCWGDNLNNQLGDGTTTTRLVPTVIDTGVTYIDVSVGNQHTCGITTAGVLKCWGTCASGRLGDGQTGACTPRTTPGVTDPGVTYSKISLGSSACGITTTGVLKCWGDNGSGEVGDNTLVEKDWPTIIDAGTTYQIISVVGQTTAANTCGITTAGVLKCWGSNTYGQTGVGSGPKIPTVVNAGTTYQSVSNDFIQNNITTACAITTAGVLKCWGYNGGGSTGVEGFVGDGTTTDRNSPVVIDVGTTYQSVTVGQTMCAVTSGGVLKCWGQNSTGSMGNGKTLYSGFGSNVPIQVDLGLKVQSLAYYGGGSGTSHACSITNSGLLQCWGNGATYNAVGDAGGVSRDLPVGIDSQNTYSSVAVGGATSCAITTSGDLKCWGRNTYGQVGDATLVNKTTPTIIDSGTKYRVVRTGGGTAGSGGTGGVSCGVTNTGALKCWGYGTNYQLGNNATANVTSPTQIDATVKYATVSGGGAKHVCGITSTGVLKCWGKQNQYGEIGDGTTNVDSATFHVPKTIASGTSFASVSTAAFQSCAITTAGALKCWGYNLEGELGDGTTTSRNVPTTIDTGVSYSQVSTGFNHTCGISTAGVLKCWGANSSRQLGDGTTTQRNSPVVIDSSSTTGPRYVSVSAMYTGTCALTTTGIQNCWGLGGGYIPYDFPRKPLTMLDLLPAPGSTEIVISSLTLTATSGGFNSSNVFVGDSNSNATVTMYYCNQTSNSNCVATAGSSVVLTRGAGVYTGSSAAGLTTGNVYKVLVRAVDANGVWGELTGTVTPL